MPQRVQMTRRRKWRHLHPDAVIVDRRSKWGNPHTKQDVADWGGDVDHWREIVTDLYRTQVLIGVSDVPSLDDIRAELAGRDLACWCKTTDPCHADTLLEIANATR